MDSNTTHKSRNAWGGCTTNSVSIFNTHNPRVTSPMFHITSLLREGCSRSAVEALTNNGLKESVKAENPDSNCINKSTIVQEKNILLYLHYETIVKILASFLQGGSEHIVREMSEKGTLEDLVKENGSISEETAAKLEYQLMTALSYCHEKYNTHRNISVDKVAVMNDVPLVKHSDFVAAKKLNDILPRGMSRIAVVMTQKCLFFEDVPAVGVVLWQMLLGHSSPVVPKKHAKNTSLCFHVGNNINSGTQPAQNELSVPQKNFSTRQNFKTQFSYHGGRFEFKTYSRSLEGLSSFEHQVAQVDQFSGTKSPTSTYTNSTPCAGNSTSQSSSTRTTGSSPTSSTPDSLTCSSSSNTSTTSMKSTEYSTPSIDITDSTATTIATASTTVKTITILDWDDTLCPTTHLGSLGLHVRDTDQLPSNLCTQLDSLATAVVNFLEDALRFGKVVIITNAQAGWVELSGHRFLSRVLSLLSRRFIKIVSARASFEQRFPNDSTAWKVAAFSHEVDVMFPNEDELNVLVFGDSMSEIDAGKALSNKLPRSKVKTVKFVESPSIDQIIGQVQLVTQSLPAIVSNPSSFDINIAGN